MNKSKILIFLLAILMIVSISAVSAADIADSDDLSQAQDDSAPLEVDEATDDVQANDESTQSAETGNDLAPLQASIDDKGADELSVDKDVEKLSKKNSSVTIDPIDNVTYGEPVVVKYNIDNRSSNVTVSVRYNDGGLQPTVEGAVCDIKDNNVTITNLTAGKYVIFIFNNEDGNFTGNSTAAFFNVTKATPQFDVNAYVDEFGIIEVNVTTNKTATGEIGFKIDNGQVMPYPILNGTVNFAELTKKYDKGTHNVTVIYKGDDNYKNASYNTTVEITKDVPVIDIQSAVVDQFGAIVVKANITKGTTENVTFLFINHDTDKNWTVPIPIGVNGTIEYSELEPFAKGHYSVQIGYDGDANYYAIAENAQTEVNVTKTAPVMEIISASVNQFGAIVVKANITKGATGNVTFIFRNMDTGKNMTVPIEIGANGTIEYDELEPFAKGYYDVEIGYDGDANYYVAHSVKADVNVTKTAPAMNYTVKVVGGEVTIAVTLPSDINGNLTVTYPSGYVENVTVKNGTASINYTAMNETGDLAITASFAGNDKYYADEAIIGFIIKQATLVKASAVSVVYQNNAKVTVKLTNLVTNKAIAGAPVEITVNGKTYKGTTNKDGNAVITIPANMLPKKYTANLVYKGNETLESDVDEFTFTVKKATPKVTAKKKTFKKSVKVKKYTITLKDNKGKAIKKAKVTIKVGKKTFKATTNAKGKAVFKLKKLTKKAKYNAKITYKGNSYFNKVTKKVKITIK